MLATPSQAVDEWARNVGAYPRFVAHQWLLHDWDVWVANPHYRGPDQGHPEADEYTSEQMAAFDAAERWAHDPRGVDYWANAR